MKVNFTKKLNEALQKRLLIVTLTLKHIYLLASLLLLRWPKYSRILDFAYGKRKISLLVLQKFGYPVTCPRAHPNIRDTKKYE